MLSMLSLTNQYSYDNYRYAKNSYRYPFAFLSS